MILTVNTAALSNFDITTSVTTAQAFNANNQTLTVGASGPLTVDTSSAAAAAVSASSNTGEMIVVDTGNSSTGIAATGDTNGAIALLELRA